MYLQISDLYIASVTLASDLTSAGVDNLINMHKAYLTQYKDTFPSVKGYL